MGYIAKTGDLSIDNLRRAVIYGSVMGSYACERFSVERLKDLALEEVEERVRHFREMTSFELPMEAGAGV